MTRRGSLRAPQTRFGRLRSIDFELLNAAGPVLTVLFDQTTSYRVSQGDDFQSIVVEIFGPKGPGKCSKVFAGSGAPSGWTTTVNQTASLQARLKRHRFAQGAARIRRRVRLKAAKPLLGSMKAERHSRRRLPGGESEIRKDPEASRDTEYARCSGVSGCGPATK